MNVGESIKYGADRFSKDLVCLKFLPPQGYQAVARDFLTLQKTLSPVLLDDSLDVDSRVLEELGRITGVISAWLNRPLNLDDRLKFRMLLDHYAHVEWAYEGPLSVVLKAKNYDSEMVALKVPKPSSRFSEAAFMAEIEAQVDLKKIGLDDNLLHMREARLTPYPCIELDWLPGTTLADHIDHIDEPFPYKEALQPVFRLVRGVIKAHDRGRVHLDINPQNIVFKGPTVSSEPVLIDWGLSSMETPAGLISYTDRFKLDRELSPEYAAPEQLDTRFGLPSRKTDVYRLALIAYELLTDPGIGFLRGRRTSEQAINFAPLTPSQHPNIGSGFPKGLDELIMFGLRPNVSERSTLDEFGKGLAKILGLEWV
jgi:serine/threonine protein kinase